MSPLEIHDRKSIGAWIKWALNNPEPYNSTCILKLNQNVFPFDDFEIDPSSNSPVFKPHQNSFVEVTPLSAAAYSGDEEAVEVLLEYPNPHHGASRDLISPISLALLSEHFSIVKMLKLKQADAIYDESRKTTTIMHAAARKGRTDLIRPLHDFDMDVRDADGVPPAVHTLYLEEDQEVWGAFSELIDRGAPTEPGFAWHVSLTYPDLARAMGKSKALVDLLEEKCRSKVRL
ncbi:Ankyrin repeat and SOCS box protein 3 [Fusarium austroafricanum]|uniref:Ankyrin repeat and SOCS box protein 3 n=1 Tax=Fusarium austroafricanum TaxID=2364996 RepID=A0A8H4KFC6_9HYPO|nr:Ankyrin repeat and SOCS box protein 3 [Fusarium austroafricanum]